MKRIIPAAAAAVSMLAPQAFAQEGSGWYATLGYSHIEYDGSNFSGGDDNVGAVTLRGGYDFSPYLSLEVEGSTGVNKSESSITGVPDVVLGGPGTVTGVGRFDNETELSHSFGAFAKVQYPLSDRVKVFGRAGFMSQEYDTRHTVSVVAPDGAEGSVEYGSKPSDEAVAIGAGFEFDLTERHGLRAGYTRSLGDLEQDTFELSYVYRFGK